MGDRKPSDKPEKKVKPKKYPRALIKWTPNPPVIHEDNIMSSEAREKNIWGFIPTYENEECDMTLLITGEYGRIWLKQHAVFDKETYTRAKVMKSDDVNPFGRRFVQRIMSYQRPTKCSWLEARYRDWNKLSEEEKTMIALKETKYKVPKICSKSKPQPRSKKDHQNTNDIPVKCICKPKEAEPVRCLCSQKEAEPVRCHCAPKEAVPVKCQCGQKAAESARSHSSQKQAESARSHCGQKEVDSTRCYCRQMI